MKTKIALIATGTLVAVGIGMHINHYCPLQQLKHSVNHTAPAPAAGSQDKPGTVTMR